jgi:hypothetical protein
MTEQEEQNTEVKIIRLNTGEDIIGTCLFDDDGNNLLIDSPMKVYVTRATELGKTMLIMMPWLPLEIVEDNMASISYDDVITMVNPKSHFIEYYFETVNHYEALVEKTSQEEQFESQFEDDDEMDEDTMEQMLEIIKERKNKSIH